MTSIRTCDRCGEKITRNLLKCKIGKKWEDWCEPCWKGFCDWYNYVSESESESTTEEEVQIEADPQPEYKVRIPRGGTIVREVYEAALSLKEFTNREIAVRCGWLTYNQVLHSTKTLCIQGYTERVGGPRSGHYRLIEVAE